MGRHHRGRLARGVAAAEVQACAVAVLGLPSRVRQVVEDRDRPHSAQRLRGLVQSPSRGVLHPPRLGQRGLARAVVRSSREPAGVEVGVREAGVAPGAVVVQAEVDVRRYGHTESG